MGELGIVGNRRGHGLQHGYDYFQNRTRHVGDTGNIVSTDVDGWTEIDVEDKMANMHYGHTNSILYRTVVIHQLEDFGRSPIGPRIACGIIWPEMKSRPPKPPTTPTPPTTPAPTPTTPAAPMYQEMDKTWLTDPTNLKGDEQCKFI